MNCQHFLFLVLLRMASNNLDLRESFSLFFSFLSFSLFLSIFLSFFFLSFLFFFLSFFFFSLFFSFFLSFFLGGGGGGILATKNASCDRAYSKKPKFIRENETSGFGQNTEMMLVILLFFLPTLSLHLEFL